MKSGNYEQLKSPYVHNRHNQLQMSAFQNPFSLPSYQAVEPPELAPLGNLNDSLDIFNILKNQQRCSKVSCYNSKQMFPWFARSIDLSLEQQRQPTLQKQTVSSFVDTYNTERDKIKHRLPEPIEIQRVESSQQGIQAEEAEVFQPEELNRKIPNNLEDLRRLLPPHMRDLDIEYPNQYLKGLEVMHQPQIQIKTDRRRRVERYLEKRRMKTWNKKICYNCRQKVAEERLRVKGRFIAHKKVMEMLGIKNTKNVTGIRITQAQFEKK